ncbi:polysaccharide biosynthesis C-terminal domain-containing protein [Membranicola marinus]|uniref:Polysaccharide biosynthesis C-terminal domain-containing protein n=1 Tax=Membranihabitans marinus TaxID=1227546 RepID=A0A953HWR6_9BACT|nr:polysaccharide biosynthesis C-terminal domain-containing protein [Membranihabitans marinus]MBY5959915.1 polysaccharide biosynthesis C-terminal domain-containing protein [Membranihabitans marinus]
MGVIKRQGIKQTIVSYLGVTIGFVSTLFIYPLEESMYGIAKFMLGTAGLIGPVLSLGIDSLVIRFFPEFKNKNKSHFGFLGLLVLLATLSFLMATSILFLFKNDFYVLLEWLRMDVDVFSDNILEITTLTFLLILITILTKYISNFRLIVVPGIVNSLFFKIGLPILILLFHYQTISIPGFKWGLIIIHGIIVFSLLIYIHKIGELHLKPMTSILTRRRISSMVRYSLYGMVGNFGSNIAFRVDAIMTATLLSFRSTGIYGIAENITNVIITPYQSMSSIASPIISQNMKSEKFAEVNKLYKSSSLILMIAGITLLTCVYVSIDDIFRLSNKYDTLVMGKNVVLLLGIAKVFDMTTGLNSQIINYSPFYSFNLYMVITLGILNIYFNFTFIPIYQLNGAALATLLSLTLYNLLKFVFVWKKFDMQPFSWKHVWVLLIGILAYLVGHFIPKTGYLLLTIALKSGITLSIIASLVLYFKISPDLNQLIYRLLKWRK